MTFLFHRPCGAHLTRPAVRGLTPPATLPCPLRGLTASDPVAPLCSGESRPFSDNRSFCCFERRSCSLLFDRPHHLSRRSLYLYAGDGSVCRSGGQPRGASVSSLDQHQIKRSRDLVTLSVFRYAAVVAASTASCAARPSCHIRIAITRILATTAIFFFRGFRATRRE